MVPTNSEISMMVGAYIDQLPGMKSRCSEMTMMLKRSSHMPTLTNRLAIHITTSERRIVRNQKICGTSTLQNICAQKNGAYGPVILMPRWPISNIDPEYQS